MATTGGALELASGAYPISERVAFTDTFADAFAIDFVPGPIGGGDGSMSAPSVGQHRFEILGLLISPFQVVTVTTFPATSDPPNPPVFPYFFSTAEVYGRENSDVALRMIRGDDYDFTGEVYLDGELQDITDTEIAFTAKWSVEDADADAVIQLSVGSGITLSDPTNGEFTVSIPAADTSGLPDHTVTLKYDIQWTDATAKIRTLTRGDLVVRADVTSG